MLYLINYLILIFSITLIILEGFICLIDQVPKGIEDNKANICMAPGSPPNVRKAFSAQFETDFLTFLKCRSEELVKGGRMVLTILGRKNEKPSFLIIELLAMALNELVSEVDKYSILV